MATETLTGKVDKDALIHMMRFDFDDVIFVALVESLEIERLDVSCEHPANIPKLTTKIMKDTLFL